MSRMSIFSQSTFRLMCCIQNQAERIWIWSSIEPGAKGMYLDEATSLGAVIKGLLKGYVQSLFDEGLINDHFSQLQTLKTSEDPERPVRLISTYMREVDTILSELTRESDLTDVDFSKLGILARKIQEKSSFIGAEHVRSACTDLIQACDRRHKQNFNQSLDWIKIEFDKTRKKLDSFVQMERRILRLERKQDI